MPILLKKQAISVYVIIFIIITNISAQKNTDTVAKASYFKGSLSYLSNSVYNGRKDSLTTPYITPTIGYYNKSGFYANGSLSYLLSATEKRIDLFTLEAGYDFNFTTKFSGGIYADKYFYNQSSTNIQSDIKGTAGASLGYDFGVLQVNAGADVLFANKTDISINAGLSHAFYLGEEDKQWTINPSATANMSTLNFYEGYTNRRVGKNAQKANANAGNVASFTTITNRGIGLTLLDYELSLPINYDAKSWGFAITPTLALPQNPIYTSTTSTLTPRIGTPITQTRNSTPASEKQLNGVFYAEASVYIKF